MNCKYPLPEGFHAADATVTRQTISESILEYSIDCGSFTIHHGKRDGLPIVIAEHHNQKAEELSGIWYSEGASE